jgi:hypothetical protein
MVEMKYRYKILIKKPLEGEILLGDLRRRWEENTNMGLKETGQRTEFISHIIQSSNGPTLTRK